MVSTTSIAAAVRGRRLFYLGLTYLLQVAGVASANDDSASIDGERVAWQYTQKDLTVTIVRSADGKWIAERSDGRRPAYNEIARTAEYVELQNRETKLLVRLHAKQAYWRRPKDADWTPWVKGGWISRGLEPVSPMPAADHRIRLAYFVPRDRKPTANYEPKIRVVMGLVAQLYLNDLRTKGYQTAGLRFETKNAEPVIHLVRGEREAAYYNNAPRYDVVEQWRRLLPEIRSKVGDTQRQVIVVFTETYDDGPAEHLWPGVIARGAYYTSDGGLAVYSGHVLRDEFCALTPREQRPLFFDQTPVHGRKAWGHRMNSPRCEFVEDGIGAVAHELGHALGLPHDRREDALYIMGNGFRNLRSNFGGPPNKRVRFSEEDARLLMSSRYLAGDLDLKDNDPPQVELGPLAKVQAGWTIKVKASDNTGLRAIVFIDRHAGSVIAGRELKGKVEEFRQNLVALDKESRALKLQVIITDDGGNQSRY